jgi:uncharacterized cupredoxin-like copper-binding protein
MRGQVRIVVGLAVWALATLGLASCGGDDDRTVTVKLDEWSVRPVKQRVKSGEVTFKAKNEGEAAHEMVVWKVAGVSAIPTKDGEANEDAVPDAVKMGEVEDVNPGTEKELKLTLEPGRYVLFCNRTEGPIHHFAKGMRTPFTVTG